MTNKEYKGAPFGVQTPRFDTNGIHPRSKPPATFTEVPYDRNATAELTREMGPGKYSLDRGAFSAAEVARRASGPGWAQAHRMEKERDMPNLLNKESVEARRNLVRRMGPGLYEIPDWLAEMDKRPRAKRGILENLEERFKKKKGLEVPGPGTYGKGGVPHLVSEEKAMQSFSTVGMLDNKSSMPRTLPKVGSELGPGTYESTTFTEELNKRLISKRGPYDVFSGDRNKPIKVGHMAAPLLANTGPGQYNIKSGVDELNNEHHKKHGQFSKLAHYPARPGERMGNSWLPLSARDAKAPGPGSYDAAEVVKSFGHNLPGFLSTAKRDDRISQKFFTRNFNPVGAGRYEIQRYDEAQHVNGHGSVFDSKSKNLTLKQDKAHRERIRGKDVALEQRTHLVTPEQPAHQLARFTQYQQQIRGVTRATPA